jgi:uncharacterized membrane protein YhaH (DUF805 family)
VHFYLKKGIVMFCPSCGAENANDARFCGGCGNPIAVHNINSGEVVVGEQMSFGKSISTCFSKYVVWKGRASRAEYWWFLLFTSVVGWAAMTVSAVTDQPFIYYFYSMVVFLPSLSAMVRRLHDTNRSGWWYWIILTIVGAFFLLYWLIKKGDENQNNYG